MAARGVAQPHQATRRHCLGGGIHLHLVGVDPGMAVVEPLLAVRLHGHARQVGKLTGRRSLHCPRSLVARPPTASARRPSARRQRSEEHTSELQSLMRISYAVFCLKKKKDYQRNLTTTTYAQHQKT